MGRVDHVHKLGVLDRHDLADEPAVDGGLDRLVVRRVSEHMADAHDAPRLLLLREHVEALLRGLCHRLFHEHVVPEVHSLHRRVAVEMVRKRDHQDIREFTLFACGEEFAIIAEAAFGGDVPRLRHPFTTERQEIGHGNDLHCAGEALAISLIPPSASTRADDGDGQLARKLRLHRTHLVDEWIVLNRRLLRRNAFRRYIRRNETSRPGEH